MIIVSTFATSYGTVIYLTGEEADDMQAVIGIIDVNLEGDQEQIKQQIKQQIKNVLNLDIKEIMGELTQYTGIIVINRTASTIYPCRFTDNLTIVKIEGEIGNLYLKLKTLLLEKKGKISWLIDHINYLTKHKIPTYRMQVYDQNKNPMNQNAEIGDNKTLYVNLIKPENFKLSVKCLADNTVALINLSNLDTINWIIYQISRRANPAVEYSSETYKNIKIKIKGGNNLNASAETLHAHKINKDTVIEILPPTALNLTNPTISNWGELILDIKQTGKQNVTGKLLEIAPKVSQLATDNVTESAMANNPELFNAFVYGIISDVTTAHLLATIKTDSVNCFNPETIDINETEAFESIKTFIKENIQNLCNPWNDIVNNWNDLNAENLTPEKMKALSDVIQTRIELILNMTFDLLTKKKFGAIILLDKFSNFTEKKCLDNIWYHIFKSSRISTLSKKETLQKIAKDLANLFVNYVFSIKKDPTAIDILHIFHLSWLRNIYLKDILFPQGPALQTNQPKTTSPLQQKLTQLRNSLVQLKTKLSNLQKKLVALQSKL